jgi:hypothetical protein
MSTYRFDAFSLWGMNAPDLPQSIEDILHEAYPDWLLSGRQMALDSWLRGVIELNEDQAARMQAAVDEWNTHMTDDGWNPYYIVFMPTTGTENTITVTSPNGSFNESWQWS